MKEVIGMKNNLKKLLSGLLVGVLIMACLPLGAAALPSGLEFGDKAIDLSQTVRTPESLSDGEVYTYSTASSQNTAGADLPFTDFNIGLHAIGQQYQTTTVTTRRFNIVFVLDVSNSMSGTKLTNMVNAADDAAGRLNVNNNKIAVISFAKDPILERGLATKAIDLKTDGSDYSNGTVDSIKISLRTYSEGGYQHPGWFEYGL